MNRAASIRTVAATLLLLVGLAACDNMQHQENLRAFVPSRQFTDDSSARMPPAHTVSRGAPAPDDPVATGMRHGQWLAGFPMRLTRDFVVRGGERYAIFCADCHGADGAGRGIVVARGFPQPESFDDSRVRLASSGALYNAVASGSGVMYGFADRIEPLDRWAIVAYVRALQRSREATLADVPPEERPRLDSQ
jgi:Cytochrome C oxidase, cbb3-type, subunit III